MNPSRRHFLQQLTVIGGAVLLAPVLARADANTVWVSIGPAADVKPGQFTRVVLPEANGKAVIFVTQAVDRTYLALSALCTHKGCEVKWETGGHQFLCPCHRGQFDAQGKNIGGPPRRPLPAWPTKTDDKGTLWVQPPV